MSPASQAIFDAWSPPVFLTTLVILSGLVYIRGWFAIRKTRPEHFPEWRLWAFLSGVGTIWLAVGSPMDGFADALLSAHMVEHILLMSFAPPLMLLGNPSVPILRGLPRPITVRVLGPILRSKALRRLGHFLVAPVPAWIIWNVIFFGWHVPAAYNFALYNEHWHDCEHICFVFGSILFWWPLIRPWPSDARYPGWFMLPYLASAGMVSTALSAFLTFCGYPVYSYYAKHPNAFGISPLTDQITGGAIMWVVGMVVYLVPAVIVTMKLLEQESNPRA
jgi:cytochrome c oxidase assembly factor CtaG